MVPTTSRAREYLATIAVVAEVDDLELTKMRAEAQDTFRRPTSVGEKTFSLIFFFVFLLALFFISQENIISADFLPRLLTRCRRRLGADEAASMGLDNSRRLISVGGMMFSLVLLLSLLYYIIYLLYYIAHSPHR